MYIRIYVVVVYIHIYMLLPLGDLAQLIVGRVAVGHRPSHGLRGLEHFVGEGIYTSALL